MDYTEALKMSKHCPGCCSDTFERFKKSQIKRGKEIAKTKEYAVSNEAKPDKNQSPKTETVVPAAETQKPSSKPKTPLRIR